jgi:hypothetical protein
MSASAKREIATARARNDYLVYTDDDCEPLDWWLDQLLPHPGAWERV